MRTDRTPVRTARDAPAPPVRVTTAGRIPVSPGAGQPSNRRRDNRQPVDRTPSDERRRNEGRTPPTYAGRTTRTNNVLTDRSGPGVRPGVAVPRRVVADRKFTRTPLGRRYDNGMLLRKGIKVHETWQHAYFPRGSYHYPYYSPSYVSSSVFISPFGYFFGVCAPFISRSHCDVIQPSAAYIDVPLYDGDNCRGFEPVDPADNFLDSERLWQREPGIGEAVDELQEAFVEGNIDSLVALTDPKVRIAVFLRGKYRYSIDSGDYIDMTRDALRAAETITFDITRVHERTAGVYVVSGEQVYRDHDGNARKVYASFVLEAINNMWTLIQVGTAPDRVQKWR